MVRKFLNFLIIVSLTLSVALSQQPSTAVAPSVDRLRAHVTHLASDKLDGRRTGTAGATDAANYIAAEFKRLGLKGAPREVSLSRKRGAVAYYDSYLQPFPYVAGVDVGKNNLLTSDLFSSLRLGTDWVPLSISANGKVTAPAVFVGYGITSSELNYNDYAAAAATSRIAVALAGTPDGDNPHGQFARYADVRWKAIAARNAGAAALIVISGEETLKDVRPSHMPYDNRAGDAGLPVAVISRQAASRLFSGATVNDLETAARAKNLTTINQTSVGVSLTTDLVRREVFAANVIGVLEGSDPVLKNEAIVIGAHYDHLGRGGEGSLAPSEGGIHYGADDNASGTAGLLELARLFVTQKPRRTMIFIAFSGEEEGLIGSNYYVNHPARPLANTVAMINMDMIGRMKDKKLVIGGVGTASEWRSIIESANLMQGVVITATSTSGRQASHGNMPLVIGANGRTIVSSDSAKQFSLSLNEDGFGPSDHSSFYGKQIPVLFFWTGTHEDYHKPSDTADKINYEDEARILGLVTQIIREVDQSDKRPTYAVAKAITVGRSTGFRVYLGTIPNYSDSTEGLLLDGVRDDSPASKAGLKAGDKIVKLAGRDVRNVYDYTYALGEMKAGQEYEVEIMRGSERLTLKITPAARKGG